MLSQFPDPSAALHSTSSSRKHGKTEPVPGGENAGGRTGLFVGEISGIVMLVSLAPEGELAETLGEEPDEPEGAPPNPAVGCWLGELAGTIGEEPDAPEGAPPDPAVGCIIGELAGTLGEEPEEPDGGSTAPLLGC